MNERTRKRGRPRPIFPRILKNGFWGFIGAPQRIMMSGVTIKQSKATGVTIKQSKATGVTIKQSVMTGVKIDL